MSTDNLDTDTTRQISEAVALEIAGWEKGTVFGNETRWYPPDGGASEYDPPSFATDINEVLPLVERTFKAFQWNADDRVFQWLPWGSAKWQHCFASIPLEDGALARAACLALIVAHRTTKHTP